MRSAFSRKVAIAKGGISVTISGTSASFADARGWNQRSRSRQVSDSPQIGSRSPAQTSSWFVTKIFRISIFIIPRKFSEKVISCPKHVFLTFRGLSDPREAPQRPGSALIGFAIEFATIPCVRWSRDLLTKTNNSKNPKKLFGQVSYKTFSFFGKIHPTPGTLSNPTSLTSGNFLLNAK